MQRGLRPIAGGFPLSLRLIREIHAILLRGGRGADELRASSDDLRTGSGVLVLAMPRPPYEAFEKTPLVVGLKRAYLDPAERVAAGFRVAQKVGRESIGNAWILCLAASAHYDAGEYRSRHSPCPFLFISVPQPLDLLESFAFGLRQTSFNKEESCHTNCGVNPERARCTQGVVQQGERVSKDEACNPQCCDCDRHCGTANAVGENFGDHNPGHRSERHSIATYGGNHQD